MEKGKFIGVVKKYPILFDPLHEDYKNIAKKDRIWSKIARDFYTDADDLKKKWKSLRDTYAKYIKRVNSETAPKEWIWAEHMKFFRPYLFVNNQSLKDDSYSNYPGSDEYEDLNSDSNIPVVVQENEYIISENDFMDGDNEVVFMEEPPESPNIVEATIKTESSDFNITQPRSLKRTFSLAQDTTLPEHYKEKKLKAVFDEVECLLLAHAKTIKRFSAKRQAITKYKIAQVILEQELLHVQEHPNHHFESKRERYQSGSSVYSHGD
ncbi:uncharacterized protein LOC106094764 [Stomoxys calcitrans]|uniref:MADF domain-containing protein n=1 Tax=Stomoxys calcitrans TaxID=35570 RepID=A0A1I8P6E0_STOCA|nr:uncharacterized protein LOC106094764 [Stomoxys calcitrans]